MMPAMAMSCAAQPSGDLLQASIQASSPVHEIPSCVVATAAVCTAIPAVIPLSAKWVAERADGVPDPALEAQLWKEIG